MVLGETELPRLHPGEELLHARELGLPTWQQPSSPCLSSRIPYGTAVTRERLARVELAEAALRSIGIEGDLRVRYHDDLARVELAPRILGAWLEPARIAELRDADNVYYEICNEPYGLVPLDWRRRSGLHR